MRKLTLILVVLQCMAMGTNAQDKPLTYLALGDSYTIGEGVPAAENFPNQLVSLIRKKGTRISDPQIIAKTGWTTDELMNAIKGATLLPKYDQVTLLVGVNNQYRGRSVDEYSLQFEILLLRAIQLAGGDNTHVTVVSIPDWGATPFAREKGKDRAKVTEEINAFNKENRDIAYRYKVKYVDITPGSREAMIDPELLTQDNLHPSGKEYGRWANAILKGMRFE
jgi:lysophospholipase L1-like esterase